MNMNPTRVFPLVLLLGLAACGRQQERRDAALDTTSATGMAAMPLRGTALIGPMRAHLDSLQAATGPALGAALPAHDARAAELLDAMGADMAMMGMSADSAWSALTDSVRLDLAALPGLSGPALLSRARAHVGRLRRLLAMHEQMTSTPGNRR